MTDETRGKRCKSINGYFREGVFIKLKPNQRRFENTTLTKIYRHFQMCPMCGNNMGGSRVTSTMNRCQSCGQVTVVTLFKETDRKVDTE
jgi:tRNA(Ile2) C34 agmatinyltransferase TiaS